MQFASETFPDCAESALSSLLLPATTTPTPTSITTAYPTSSGNSTEEETLLTVEEEEEEEEEGEDSDIQCYESREEYASLVHSVKFWVSSERLRSIIV